MHSKIGKNRGTSALKESLAHVERQSVFSVDSLCNFTQDNVVILEFQFSIVMAFIGNE